MIWFEVVGGSQGTLKSGKGGPPGLDKHEDKCDKDRDRHQQEDKAKKSSGKFDRMGKIDKEMDSSHDESMEEGEKWQDGDKGSLITPLAAFYSTMGMVEMFHNGALSDNTKERDNPEKKGCLIRMRNQM
jgi:hypothetical protein